MEKIFLLQPRQSGKTTKALYEYGKDEDNTLFVTYNVVAAKELCGRVDGKPENFISAKQLLTLRGRSFNKIILDEYMFYSEKIKYELNEILNYHMHVHGTSLYIFSSANRKYNQKVFDFVVKNKLELSLEQMIEIYPIVNPMNNIPDFDDEIKDLYFNFITDHDTKLISKVTNYHSVNHSLSRKMLGDEAYELEVENKFLK